MKTSTSSKPHWQDRRRYIANGRMAWYSDRGDERYWYEYWKARLTPDYYASAIANDLTTDQLGKILLQTMSLHGLHLEAGCGAGMRRSSPAFGKLARAAGLVPGLLGGNGGSALTGAGGAAGDAAPLAGLVFDPALKRGSSLLGER